jgi:acetolactate synthase-1/2/3 large subunit
VSDLDELARIANGLAFGIPGGGKSLELADAIERRGGRFHTVRFEGSAALMAGAVGRLTGSPGVAVSIKGPGLANMVAGLATCTFEDFPVLAVAEAFDRGEQRAHKRIDQDQLTRAVVKARSGFEDKGVAGRMAALATQERPAPVLIELARTGESASISTGASSARDDGAVLKQIEASRRPVIVAGSAVARRGWKLDGLRVPVFTTASAKGTLDETSPHSAGLYTGVGRTLAPETSILAQADLVIGLALRSHEVLGTKLPVPAVNIDVVDADDGFSFAARGSVDGAQPVLDLLCGRPGWGDDLVASSKARMRRALLDGPFLPAQAFDIAGRKWPRARIVLDTGFFCTVGEHVWEVRAPDLYLSSGQGRSMGACLPMAIGAAMLRRNEPTILAIGDGGIGMFAAELALAVAERLPLLVLLMRDGTYASVRDRAVATGLTQAPLMVKSPDWPATAGAMGLKTWKAANEGELSSALDAWQPKDGPALIEIAFDPEPYRTMTNDLRA